MTATLLGASGHHSATDSTSSDNAITVVMVVEDAGTPENLTVKGIGDGVVTLSFNANANPTVLIRRVVANTSTTVTLQTPNSNVAYTDGGVNKLINGAEYRYQVAGLTTRLISGSQQLYTTRFYPAVAAIPMRIPSNLSVSIGDASALITFASDGLSVRVERVSLGTPNVTNTYTSALAQRYAASGLNNGSEYTYRVAGFAHGLTTPYSALTNPDPDGDAGIGIGLSVGGDDQSQLGRDRGCDEICVAAQGR